MANILHLIGPLILLSLAIPLAILAAITTTLAFSALFIRVSIVYFELGTALVTNSFFENTPRISLEQISEYPASPDAPTRMPNPRKRRRSSLSQAATFAIPPPPKSKSFASIVGSSGPTRDFEGVGGWSLAADANDEALCMGRNTRLQLPTSASEKPRRLHHHRSLSSQSQIFGSSSTSMRMSPAVSRNRTPLAVDTPRTSNDYFDFQTLEIVPMSPEEKAAKSRMKIRRQSLTSSSASSVGSASAAIPTTQPLTPR